MWVIGNFLMLFFDKIAIILPSAFRLQSFVGISSDLLPNESMHPEEATDFTFV